MAAPSAEMSGDLRQIAGRLRGQAVRMSHATGSAHLGSALSCIDILTAAYWRVLRIDPASPAAPERDRFILSKGHAASALYAALSLRGFFSSELLDTYNTEGSRLAEHPGPGCAPGVEAATGSLGHGLPIGLGMALAGRIQRLDYRVFVLMSDGECNEGSVWEAAMAAPSLGLNNLCVVIDYNKWQATGRSNDVLALAPLRDKWAAFGWAAEEVDGHDPDLLAERMLGAMAEGGGKPAALIAHTIKGKGVSFMEDDNNWHYRTPNADETARALQELGLS